MNSEIKERKEKLPIAKKLDKFIPLPNLHKWKVHDLDVLMRGRVLCFLRRKRSFLPDRLTSLKMRMVTITRHGYLVLYENVEDGLIIDLRQASHILTSVDRYKSNRATYRRSHIKIRLSNGNAHLFVRDENIAKWTNAILVAHTKHQLRPMKLSRTVDDVEPRTAIEEEVVNDSKDRNDSEDEQSKIEEHLEFSSSPSSNSGMITVIENPPMNPLPSIRRGTNSVTSLRRRLEKKLVLKSSTSKMSPIVETADGDDEDQGVVVPPPPPSPEGEPPLISSSRFVSSLFVYHNGASTSSKRNEVVLEEPTTRMFVIPESDEEDEVKKPEAGKRKEWWMRSLRC